MNIEQRLTDTVKKIAKAVVTDITTSLTEAIDYRALDAAEKVRIIKEMGFTPTGADHDDGCAKLVNNGYVCNCVIPATLWSQPLDVDVLRNETWDERLAASKRRRSE